MPISRYTYYDYTISLCPECLRRIEDQGRFESVGVKVVAA